MADKFSPVGLRAARKIVKWLDREMLTNETTLRVSDVAARLRLECAAAVELVSSLITFVITIRGFATELRWRPWIVR